MKRIAGTLVAALAISSSTAAPMALANPTVAAAEAAQGETLGISKTKPASGPYVEVEGGYMVPYVHQIERTNISFEMIPIPGGTFTIGSPETEEGRSEDEGPQFTVKVDPFWMAKTELTWAEYKTFMRNYDIFKRLRSRGVRPVDDSNRADAITVPTPLYDPSHTYKFGDDAKQPAVSMTQYAAKQYTKWLSGITQVQYRLPTEAEWEYAARAGSQTAYSFGDSAENIEEYATFADNGGDAGASKVGLKKPNAFGLHDMHGNVWEWTVDQYSEEGYGEDKAGKTLSVSEAVNWPQGPDFSAARGGGFQDSPDRLRSAARIGSVDEEWKSEDPNIPLSPWWYTSDPARMIGMRLVRSYQPLSADDIKNYWSFGDESVESDVKSRLEDGRGVVGLPVPELIPEFQRRR